MTTMFRVFVPFGNGHPGDGDGTDDGEKASESWQRGWRGGGDVKEFLI